MSYYLAEYFEYNSDVGIKIKQLSLVVVNENVCTQYFSNYV
jgi:CHASE3 domain sensor protein